MVVSSQERVQVDEGISKQAKLGYLFPDAFVAPSSSSVLIRNSRSLSVKHAVMSCVLKVQPPKGLIQGYTPLPMCFRLEDRDELQEIIVKIYEVIFLVSLRVS